LIAHSGADEFEPGDGLLDVPYGLGQPALLALHLREVSERARFGQSVARGPEYLNGLLVMSKRLLEIPEFALGHAEIVERDAGLVTLTDCLKQIQSLAVIFRRLRRVAQQPRGHADVVERHRLVLLVAFGPQQRQRLLVIFERLRGLAEVTVSRADVIEHYRQKRLIALRLE